MFWGSYLAWGNLRCVMLFHLLWLVMRSSHQTRQDLEKLSSFCIPFSRPSACITNLGSGLCPAVFITGCLYL